MSECPTCGKCPTCGQPKKKPYKMTVPLPQYHTGIIPNETGIPCMFDGLEPNKAYGIACSCPKCAPSCQTV